MNYKDCKNKNIIICIISSIFIIPILINKLIFFVATTKNKHIEKGNFYKWRLGNIHYKVYGTGSPLLLVHGIGIGCSMFEWKNNIDYLSKHHKVYTIDLLGYGLSDKPKTTYTAYMYSLLINDFIQSIIKEPVGIISSSTSSIFAVIAYKINPSNFKKIMLIEPTGITDKIPQNNDILHRKLFELPILGTCIYNYSASKYFIKKFIYKNVMFAQEKITDDIINNFYFCAHYGGQSSRYSFASFISNFMNFDIKNIISEIKIPLYIIWGENATINKVENMEIIENIKADAKFAVFEKTRLLPQFENSIEFNKLAKIFFK